MPATYFHPGVYVEEMEPLARPIAGVSTSTAGFIGVATKDTKMPETPQGVVNPYKLQDAKKPKLVTSWEEFRQSFGNVSAGNKYLALAVYGFFNNGGTRCYVARIDSVNTNDIDACLAEFEKIDEISIVAAPLPPEKEEISAADEAQQKAAAFKQALDEAVTSAEAAKEIATRELNEAKEAEAAAEADFKKAVWWEGEKQNASSAADAAATGKADDDPLTIAAKKAKQSLQAATDDKKAKETIFKNAETARGLAEKVEKAAAQTLESAKAAKAENEKTTPPPSVAGAPPASWPYATIYTSLITHCTTMNDRVAILDSSRDATPTDVKTQLPASEKGYAAFYFPWIQVADPTNGRVFVPPSGAIAGIYARTDSERGVHKAPANEAVLGVLGLSCQVTGAQQDGLNEIGVNCIRNFYGSILVWGGRTLAANVKAGGDQQWKYINVRRFMIFLQESIEQNLRWVVFEPNDRGLWQRIVRTVSDFLLTQWRAGALFGETPKQAFFVRCDDSTNPSQTRELGQVITEIGVAIVKPAEFVIFRIQQQTGG